MKASFTLAIVFLMCLTYLQAQTSLAGSYYSLYKHMSRQTFSKYTLEEVSRYPIKNGMKVLDVGGSDGKLVYMLSVVCDSIDYYIEDINPEDFFYAPKLVALARKKLNPAERSTVHQITGTDSTIPTSIIFDAIVVRETFHHFTKPAQMLNQFKQMLAPVGKLVISEPASQKNFHHCVLVPPDKLIAMVEAAGFKLVSRYSTKTDFVVYVFST